MREETLISHTMEPLQVCITGAAGQVGYALAFRIAAGGLSDDRKVFLRLQELPRSINRLKGVAMELVDCAFPKLAGVAVIDNLEEAFTGADCVFLVGASPRTEGMTRADLLQKNGAIFKTQGEALGLYAKKDVRVLVVGNPCNTNAAICQHYAVGLGPQNFSALTRLDHNRSVGELAEKLKIDVSQVHHVCVWGNHSNTQVPDLSHTLVELPTGTCHVSDCLPEEYIHGEFVDTVATRGGAVLKMRGYSSAASAASASLDCMRNWIYGTEEDTWVSMAIPVPESRPYGIEPGIFFSFPVTVDRDGVVHIVEGLENNEWVQQKIRATAEELVNEKQSAFQLLGIEN